MATEELTATIRAELSGFQGAMRQTVQTVEQTHRAVEAANKAAQARELAAVRQAGRAEVDAVRAAGRERLQALQQTHRAAEAALKGATASEQAALRQKHQAEANAEREAGRASVTAVQTAARERVQARQQGYQQELQALRRKHQQEIEAERQAAQQSVQASQNAARLRSQALGLAGAVGVPLGVTGLIQFGKDAIDAANRFNAFALSLKNATGSLASAQQSLAFVRGEANRLGLDITEATRGFARLANATRGTALAGDATREIFTALSESSRVLGLSTEEYGRALTAVGQIALKGRVQQEELLQLAEAGIPIYGALAQSLGKTTGELAKMLEQGQVSATQLGAAFSVLRQQTQGVAEASESFAARTTRLSNTFTEFLVQVGRLITESANARQALAALTIIMEKMAKTDLRKELGFIEGTMKDIANILHIVNTLWARLSGDELQKARDAHAATETRIRGTKDELEFLKSAGDSAWKGYLLSVVRVLTNAPSVEQSIKNQEEALKALGVQQDLQVKRVLSIERARRLATQVPASEGLLLAEDRTPIPPSGPFATQTAAILKDFKSFQEELAGIATQKGLFDLAEDLKLARKEVTETEKFMAKMGETWATTNKSAKELPPELVKIRDETAKLLTQQQQHVEVLEKQEKPRRRLRRTP